MTISISGTVYSDEGVTPILDGVTLNCSINGAASSGTTTSSAVDGTYTISGLTAAAAIVVTVYIQDFAHTQKAVTVTRSTGSNMTGIDLYQDHLNIRSDDGTAFSGTNMNRADNAVPLGEAQGISAIFAANSNTTTTMVSGKHLLIMSGQTYAPGGTSTVTIRGNWINNGTFIADTVTVILDSTAQTISSSTTFYNLTASTTGDVITFTDGTTQTVTNSVTFQNVTLQGSSTGGWTIAMPATQTIDHTVVSHSTATGNTAVAGATSTNGGSNVNWTFGTVAALVGLGGLSGLSGLSSVA